MSQNSQPWNWSKYFPKAAFCFSQKLRVGEMSFEKHSNAHDESNPSHCISILPRKSKCFSRSSAHEKCKLILWRWFKSIRTDRKLNTSSPSNSNWLELSAICAVDYYFEARIVKISFPFWFWYLRTTRKWDLQLATSDELNNIWKKTLRMFIWLSAYVIYFSNSSLSHQMDKRAKCFPNNSTPKIHACHELVILKWHALKGICSFHLEHLRVTSLNFSFLWAR